MMTSNALILLAENPTEILGDGVTGNEPIFDVALMKELASEKLGELKSLPAFDLTTEAGRKSCRAAIKPIKQIFTDFEKNIKAVKKAFSEIPKKCDAVSKALRDMSEPVIAEAEAPFSLIKEQEVLVQKWWKKEGIPFNLDDVNILMNETKSAKPLDISSEKERSDFQKYQIEYLTAIGEAQQKLIAAEASEKAEKDRQAAESERLRLEAASQARVAAEQAKAQEALEAENRRLEAEKAEFERQKQQAAVNPAQPQFPPKEIVVGAPPVDMDHAKTVRRQAVDELTAFLDLYMNSKGIDNLNVSDTRLVADGFARLVYSKNGQSSWGFNYG